MKKLLLLLVGVVVAFAAHADLYLVGNNVASSWTGNMGQNWDPANAYSITKSGDYWCFKAEGDFKVSTVKAGWNDGFNANAMAINYKDQAATYKWVTDGNIRKGTMQKPYGENSSAPDGWTGTVYYRIKLVGSAYAIEAAQNTADFDGGSSEITDKIYLVGASVASDWNTSTAENWTPTSANEVVLKDGYYSFAANGEYQLSTVKKDWDSGWKSNTLAFSAWSVDGNLATATVSAASTEQKHNAPSGWSGTVYYRMNADKTQIEAGKTKDAFTVTVTDTYKLYTNLGGNPQDYDLTADNNYTKSFTLNGTETDKYVGIKINDSWRGASVSGAVYNGTTATYSMTATSDNRIDFATNLKGTITLVYTPTSNQLSISGGSVVVTPDPEEGDYTIYFYDSSASQNVTNVKAYVWNKAGRNVAAYPGEAMTPVANKFVKVGDNYYPAWSYSFSTDINPDHVLFVVNNNKTGDLEFENGYFYTNNGSRNGNLSLVEKPKDDVVTIYMHWKEDFIKKGNGDAPYCHVFNNTNNAIYTTWKSDEEKMYLVNEKYQIWGFDVKKTEVSKYNDVLFHFYSDANCNNKVDEYTASTAGTTRFDAANWTKYIYTVHDGQYCVQSYLTYDEFLGEAGKGYPYVYVIGGGDTGRNNKMEITLNGTKSDLPWDPAQGVKIDPYTSEDPCFYLELTPTFDSHGTNNGTWNARFKLTWIDVAGYQAKNGGSYKEGQRDWATFDLGCIGVDDEKATAWGMEVDINNRYCYFQVNKSFPMLEYNQYDWTLTNEFGTSGKTYWAVVDLHPSCRTVTLTTFDPDPSVEGEVSSLNKVSVDDATAEAMHVSHFKAADNNGHVHMTELNAASGKATIKRAPGLVVDNAGFTVRYTLNINGTTREYDAPGTINFDYMPVAANSGQVSVRGKFTDNQTKLTFHSRIGKGEITLPQAKLNAPKDMQITGRYVFQEKRGNKEVYGVYITDLDCEFDAADLNAYADFDIVDGPAKFVHEDLEWYQVAKDIEWVKPWSGWTYGDSWSEKFRDERVADNPTPIFIHDVVEVDSFDDLEEMTLSGEVIAVYPFLYNPNASLSVASSAPAAGKAAPRITDFTGFVVRNTPISTPVSISVSPEGAVSAVDMVAEEVNDAPVEYYTISGMKVYGDPTPGIYVRRQGDKVTKVVIR